MSDLGASTWSEVDASNNAAVPNGWPEGMQPSGVNNSARANMGAEKRFWNRINAVKTTGGTTSAYTLTYDAAAVQYYDGEIFAFIVNATNAIDATLNINGLGARQIRKFVAGAYVNLAAGDIVTDQPLEVRYNLADLSFDIFDGRVALRASLATDGYQELVPGILMQWGTNTVSVGSPATITFPVAFSAAPYSIQVTARSDSGPLTNGSHSASSPTTTNFVLTNGGTNNIAFYWLAVGTA